VSDQNGTGAEMDRIAVARRACLLILAVVGWSAVLLQLGLVVREVTAEGGSPLVGLVDTFSYFTVLTNTLVAAVATASLWGGRGGLLARPAAQAATAVYIFVVGLIYSLMLRTLWAPTGLQKAADVMLHDLTPLLYTAYWLVLASKDGLRWPHAGWWLGYPAAYIAYSFGYGAVTGRYLYPFTDLPKLSFLAVMPG